MPRPVRSALIGLLLALGLQSPVLAETAPAEVAGEITPEVADLLVTLQMSDTFGVMVEEGLQYGASIEEQMFPGQGGPRWKAMVAQIYDQPTLEAAFNTAFAEALANDPATIAAASEFFGSDRGRNLLTLEIEARRALLDEAVEEAALVEAERMQAERDPRIGLIRDLIEASDLVEANVAGALTANLAFFQGMASVGAPGMAMDDEQMMTEVWSQESSIRDETSKWLYPFLTLAYGPVSDADLKTYTAFMGSPEGKRMNAALFSAFDAVFRKVSFDLGHGAALVMQGNDI